MNISNFVLNAPGIHDKLAGSPCTSAPSVGICPVTAAGVVDGFTDMVIWLTLLQPCGLMAVRKYCVVAVGDTEIDRVDSPVFQPAVVLFAASRVKLSPSQIASIPLVKINGRVPVDTLTGADAITQPAPSFKVAVNVPELLAVRFAPMLPLLQVTVPDWLTDSVTEFPGQRNPLLVAVI